jgi:hypothetical protein
MSSSVLRHALNAVPIVYGVAVSRVWLLGRGSAQPLPTCGAGPESTAGVPLSAPVLPPLSAPVVPPASASVPASVEAVVMVQPAPRPVTRAALARNERRERRRLCIEESFRRGWCQKSRD